MNLTDHKTNYKYITFHVDFLLKRYHGKEWPPSPRRFFLALVAALYQSSKYRIDLKAGERALLFFEKQEPPQIHGVNQSGTKYTIFVPDNDMDLISKFFIEEKIPTIKPSKLKSGKGIIPHMVNQLLQYSWKIDIKNIDDEKNIKTLCDLSREITVLGLGIDPVTIHGTISDHIFDMNNSICYIPDKDGESSMIVPIPGLLDDAKRHHKEFLNRLDGETFTNPKPISKWRQQRYRKNTFITDIIAFKLNPISVGQETSKSFIDDGAIVNIIKILDEKQQKYLSNMMEQDKLCIKITILPSIGGKYADLMIRRIGFIVPSNMSKKIKEKLSSLDGDLIRLGNEKYQLELLSNKDDPVLKSYTSRSLSWCSVRPFEINLNKNTDKNTILNSIFCALEKEGIDIETIDFINFRKEPYWNNLPKVSPDQTIFRMYVELEFQIKISGPFMAGENQKSGFGLFAPKRLPDVAYFAILGKKPSVKHTIEVGDLMRYAVMSKFQDKNIPSRISGHDAQGKPLLDHTHAFWLPYDDNNDGFIDHIAVFVKEGFGNAERHALSHITRLYNKSSLELNLHFKGFHGREDIASKCLLFDKKKDWQVITPYFMPWHIKKQFAVEEQIKKECDKRFSRKVDVTSNSNLINICGKNIHVKNFVSIRNNKKPINGIGHAVTISFEEPIRGPIVLGHGCHFGLGIFVPSTRHESQQER